MNLQESVASGEPSRDESPLDLTTARAAIEKAHRLVGELSAGTQKWTMHVPVDMNRDSDMILTSALTTAELLIAEIERLRAEVDTQKTTAESMTLSLKRRVEEARELGTEIEQLRTHLVGRDKLLRRAFEAGDNAIVVIARDESWDRWAR